MSILFTVNDKKGGFDMAGKRYVPDISAFFGGEQRLTVDDIVNLPPIRQETVSFRANDIYERKEVFDGTKVNLRRCKKFRKRRRRGKFKRS